MARRLPHKTPIRGYQRESCLMSQCHITGVVCTELVRERYLQSQSCETLSRGYVQNNLEQELQFRRCLGLTDIFSLDTFPKNVGAFGVEQVWNVKASTRRLDVSQKTVGKVRVILLKYQLDSGAGIKDAGLG